jgi:hypothetical protein
VQTHTVGLLVGATKGGRCDLRVEASAPQTR